jgi:hypothetical protein
VAKGNDARRLLGDVFDMSGNTMAVVLLPANVLRPPTPAIVPTVRAQGG